MNQILTELVFVLDRSGSMNCVAENAVADFNAFLRDQQTAPGDARFTLVLFDDEYLVPANALPISQVAPLDATTYIPRGSTALLDAMGRTIDDLGRRLSGLPEPERPARVIVAILTDGHENASQKYTLSDVAARIRRQRDEYSWQFLFLGANQDAIATAAQLNIAAHDAATFQADAAGAKASFKSTSRKASSLRALAVAAPGAPPPADVAMPLSEMLAEEDQLERGKP